ncbi:hypothetical protein, partial [Aeromonas allosaccharophila]
GDKIRSQTKPFLYLFQLVAAKDPVHVLSLLPIKEKARLPVGSRALLTLSELSHPWQGGIQPGDAEPSPRLNEYQFPFQARNSNQRQSIQM